MLAGFGAIFLLTLGFDEAWILEGLHGIVKEQDADLRVSPVVGSGGLFAVGQILVTLLCDNTLWAHRLFVFCCLLTLVGLLARLGLKRFGSWSAAPVLPSLMLGLPGPFV